MKKLFITLALVCSTLPALAQHHGHGFRHHRHYHGHDYRSSWVAPLVIGGVISYALTRPEPIIVQQPIIIEQQSIIQNQNCGLWTEVQTSDGKIYRERTCTSQ